MDLTTILGLVGCTILVFIGIVVSPDGINLEAVTYFMDAQSVFIVVGGVAAALVTSFPMSVLKNIPKHMKVAIGKDKFNPSQYIDDIVACAEMARKNGLLALEEFANEQQDKFLKDGLLLIVDAIDPDKVRTMLEGDLGYMAARHAEAISVYDRGSAFGPAFGMIGTLIGLINMLASLDLNAADGTEKLTGGMAVALITTFYGSILANVLFTPIASKLQVKHDKEVLCREIVIEGILSIQSGENPKFIKEKLVSFLSEKEKAAYLGSEGGEEGGEEGGKKKKEKKEKKSKKDKE